MKSKTLSLKTISLFCGKQSSFNKTLEKKNTYFLANKLIEKIPDLHNAKELHQSFIREKKGKSLKQSEIITYQPKTFEKPNCWYKISCYRISKNFT